MSSLTWLSRRRGTGARKHYVPSFEVLEYRLALSTVIQFDFDELMDFNADVVVNTADTGSGLDETQSSVDLNNVSGGNNAFLTQSAADSLGPSGDAQGIPDDGFIPKNTFHPDVQLSVLNSSSGFNALRFGPDGFSDSFPFTFATPTD